MQPFELMVLEYIRDTGNHVLYRVTPVYEGDNRLDPDYQKQENTETDEKSSEEESTEIEEKFSEEEKDQTLVPSETQERQSEEHSYEETEVTYILNTNTHRFHHPSCDSVNDMKEKNKETSTESREKLIEEGYQPCGNCKP